MVGPRNPGGPHTYILSDIYIFEYLLRLVCFHTFAVP